MDREIALPFRVDSQGRIATTDDPATVGRQHLTTFLLTDPGERTMRPQFGTPLRQAVFENLDSVGAQMLLTRIQERVQREVSTAQLSGLEVQEDSSGSGVHLNVEFRLAMGAGGGVTRSTTISLGGGAQ